MKSILLNKKYFILSLIFIIIVILVIILSKNNIENFTPKIRELYNSNMRNIKNTTNNIIETLSPSNNNNKIVKTLKQYNLY